MKLAIESKNFKGVKYAAWAPGIGEYLEGESDGGAHHICNFATELEAKPFIETQRKFGNSAKLVK